MFRYEFEFGLGSFQKSFAGETTGSNCNHRLVDVVTDALVLAPQTAGLVLVVKDHVTPTDAINRAIESAKFANINILGAIMNAANPKSKGYGYRKYGYRKYGYRKYGYSKYGYGYSNGKAPTLQAPENTTETKQQ